MKKNNTLYTICFLLAGMCINSACEDILSESPNSSYERKDFFINDAQADMAVLGIYSVLPGIWSTASASRKPKAPPERTLIAATEPPYGVGAQFKDWARAVTDSVRAMSRAMPAMAMLSMGADLTPTHSPKSICTGTTRMPASMLLVRTNSLGAWIDCMAESTWTADSDNSEVEAAVAANESRPSANPKTR